MQLPVLTGVSRPGRGPLLSLMATVSRGLQGGNHFKCNDCLLHMSIDFFPHSIGVFRYLANRTAQFQQVQANEDVLIHCYCYNPGGLSLGCQSHFGVEPQFLPSVDYTPGLAGPLQPGGGREEGDLHMIQLMVICGAISRPRTGIRVGQVRLLSPVRSLSHSRT